MFLSMETHISIFGNRVSILVSISFPDMTFPKIYHSAPKGGVSFTVGGAAAPPTLSSVTPIFALLHEV